MAGRPRRLDDRRRRGTGLDVSLTGPGVTGDHGYADLPFADLPFDGLLCGGRVGLYSQSQTPGITDFSVQTSSVPATTPTDPGALDCRPSASSDYSLPGGTETVDQVIDVGRAWSGFAVGQAILTTATDQYLAYYDEDRVMTVARRPLSSTTWTFRKLDSVLAWDSHNSVTLALDASGNLHVAGNMHDAALVYFRTTTPATSPRSPGSPPWSTRPPRRR